MQGQAVANIEKAEQGFLGFYPLPAADDIATPVCILVGAERGFCSDFNESLIDAITTEAYSGVVAIGSRLCTRLEDHPVNVIAGIEGASVAEEVPAVLNHLIDTISSLAASSDGMSLRAAHTASSLKLTVVYHGHIPAQIKQRQILPPFPPQQYAKPGFGNPPVLNLKPAVFFADLTHHYLFAVLHEIFYISLMAENQRRLQHLEGQLNISMMKR